MSKVKDIVSILEDGSVVAEGPDADRGLRNRAGRYRLITETEGLLILRRARIDEEEAGDAAADDLFGDFDMDAMWGAAEIQTDGGKVMMAGEILTTMALFHVVGIIAERKWQGDLDIYSTRGTSYCLAFDQGALKYAKTSSAGDRLGELLVREGILDEKGLKRVLKRVTPTKRFGQACLDAGVLTREQLFEFLRKQNEEVFFRALMVVDGGYVFSTPDDKRPPPDHTVHVSVQGLLMEGVQRVDEMELFREKIPSGELCPAPIAGAKPKDSKLDGTAREILACCDGKTSINDIAERTGLGEFVTTKVIYHLMREKRVRVQPLARVDETALSKMVDAFSHVIQDIFSKIGEHGDTAGPREMLRSWVNSCGYESFFGDHVASDGAIDFKTVLKAVASVREADPLESFHQVAHELVSFALFCAGSALPREVEKELSRDVNRRLHEIRSSG